VSTETENSAEKQQENGNNLAEVEGIERADADTPKRVIEAVDQTADKDILDKLWEITKLRLDEEKHRQDSTNDRASKCATYALSMLASIGIAGTFLKDLVRDGFARPTWPIYPLFLVLFCSLLGVIAHTFRAWISASKVLGVRNYKTWHEVDLSRVDLDPDEHGYLRHLIKSAWAFTPENEAITGEKMDCLMEALRLLHDALICLAVLIITTLISSAVVGSNVIKDAKQQPFEVTCMTNGSNGQTNKPAAPPQPTPKPTTGSPIKKGEEAGNQQPYPPLKK
jgi:hypothetical protein